MEHSTQSLGFKLYALHEFTRLGLYSKDLAILKDAKDKDEIIKELKQSGFEDNDEVGIRFSKDNVFNLPFYLGQFTLSQIADTVINKRNDYVPFVNKLIKPVCSGNLYMDNGVFLIELWPGIGASKTHALNKLPDLIKIDKEIKIARFLQNREVENVEGKTYTAEPFDFEYLEKIGEKIQSMSGKLTEFYDKLDSVLCDFHVDNSLNIDFMGAQKIVHTQFTNFIHPLEHEYYTAESLSDLKKYDGKQKLFFDITLKRNNNEWPRIMQTVKKIPEIYVRSLTMHVAVMLREMGIEVKRMWPKENYEVRSV